MPARPPAPAAAVPQINTGASPAAPVINDPKQSTATGRMMQRRKSNNNIVLYIAAPIAVFFVLGAIGIIALIANRKGDNAEAEQVADKMVMEFESITAALESVKDEKSAERAARRIEQSVDSIEDLVKRSKKLKITKAKDKELERKITGRMKKLSPRMERAGESAVEKSNGSPALLAALGKMAGLEKIAN